MRDYSMTVVPGPAPPGTTETPGEFVDSIP